MRRPRHMSGALGRALRQMGEDPWLQALAVASLTISLSILGAYLNLALNLHQTAQNLFTGSSFTVVLENGVDEAGGRALAKRLRLLAGVERTEYVGQAEAMARFRSELGPHQGILEGLEESPLPATVEVYLLPGPPPPELAAHLAGLPGVAEVLTSRPWLHRLELAADAVRRLGLALGALLLAGVMLLVMNMVRLAVHVRGASIEVQSLVGATPGYIRAPFLIEAALQGLIAAGLASLLLMAMFRLLGGAAALPLGLDLGQLLRFGPRTAPLLAGLAVLLGLAGGWLGVARAWKRLR